MGGVIGRIHSVETFGAVDGPGIRYVVFFQGCPLRCIFCHNPDTWHFFRGREISSEEIFNDIKKYKNFIKRGGVTLSGGEPLMQPRFAEDILKRCRREGIHTAIDTGGGIPLRHVRQVIDLADMLLLDIKAADEKMCIEITGKSNKNALDILNYCESTGKTVIIRHVLLPGYTLNSEELHRLAQYLKNYKCVERTEFLPFHKMGEYKWKALGEEYRLKDTKEPDREDVRQAVEIFASYGLNAI